MVCVESSGICLGFRRFGTQRAHLSYLTYDTFDVDHRLPIVAVYQHETGVNFSKYLVRSAREYLHL